MQIFSRLHLGSFSYKKIFLYGGFTLVEVLVAVAITALISVVVVVRFASFDSTILLKDLAYDIAVTLRETQVYSLSVLGGEQGFDTPYGMSFTPASKSYVFFQYGGDPSTRPRHDGSSSVGLNTFLIGRSLEVADICVVTDPDLSPQCAADGIQRVDISFRRPEFEALFFVVDGGGNWSEAQNGGISSVQIKVHSLAADDTWIIEVFLLGQINVSREI